MISDVYSGHNYNYTIVRLSWRFTTAEAAAFANQRYLDPHSCQILMFDLKHNDFTILHLQLYIYFRTYFHK